MISSIDEFVKKSKSLGIEDESKIKQELWKYLDHLSQDPKAYKTFMENAEKKALEIGESEQFPLKKVFQQGLCLDYTGTRRNGTNQYYLNLYYTPNVTKPSPSDPKNIPMILGELRWAKIGTSCYNLIDVIVHQSVFENARSNTSYLLELVHLICHSIKTELDIELLSEQNTKWDVCRGPFGWDKNGKSLSGFCKSFGSESSELIVSPELIVDQLKQTETDSNGFDAPSDNIIISQPMKKGPNPVIEEIESPYKLEKTFHDSHWQVSIEFPASVAPSSIGSEIDIGPPSSINVTVDGVSKVKIDDIPSNVKLETHEAKLFKKSRKLVMQFAVQISR